MYVRLHLEYRLTTYTVGFRPEVGRFGRDSRGYETKVPSVSGTHKLKVLESVEKSLFFSFISEFLYILFIC